MKKVIIAIAVILACAVGYTIYYSQTNFVTLKEWSAYEVLTASDLNTNFGYLNDAMDSLLTVARNEMGDSTAVRFPASMNIPWTQAFGDSIASNDILTIEIKKQTPLGTSPAVYIKNVEGTAEKVKLVLDFQVPGEFTKVDSLQIYTWTEATNGTDFGLISAFDDSTHLRFKAAATASSDTLKSSVARTARMQSLTGINITGGRVRFEITVNTVSDSMFLSEPKVYLTRQ